MCAAPNVLEELLISEVQKSPAVWDISNSQYKNTYFVNKEWNRIAQSLAISKKHATELWEHLKKTFEKEKKLIPVTKSGDAPSNYESSWAHYKALEFLNKNLTPKPSSGNLSRMMQKGKKVTGKSNSVVTTTEAVALSKPAVEQSELVIQRFKQVEPKVETNIDMEANGSQESDWQYFLSLLQYTKKIKGFDEKLAFRNKVSNLLRAYTKEDEEDDDEIQVVDVRLQRK